MLRRVANANHHVCMRFELRQCWHVSFMEAGLEFMEAGLERKLPRKLTFQSPGEILELARRGEAWDNLENRQALERGAAAAATYG
jgi:hypothetical protein